MSDTRSSSASTSHSDETITPYRNARARRHPDASDATTWLEASEATTACSTVTAPPKQADFELKRKSLKRLPIPESFRSIPQKYEEKPGVGVSLGFGVQPNEDTDQDNDFPQSPGHSPLSRFDVRPSQHSPVVLRRFSLSPPSLALPARLRRKQSRVRSCSDPFERRQLHPSPPPVSVPLDVDRQSIAPLQIVGLVGHKLEPEDLISPNAVLGRKRIKRKPIPTSLFSDAVQTSDTVIAEFTRSLSCPDGLSPPLLPEASPGAEIEAGNKLGLFSEEEPPEAQPRTFTSTVDSELAAVQGSSLELAARSSPRAGRLRRATRSVSESHDRAKSALRSNDTKLRASLDATAGLGFGPQSLESNPAGSYSGETEGALVERSWSPSPPTRSSSEFTELDHGASQVLRRVSRTRAGEMRSVYLSSPTRNSRPGPELEAMSAVVPDEGEGIEVLKTPDPAASGAFGHPMTSSLILAPTSQAEWRGSLATRARSSSETSMASLLVLQQHIQQRNHQRQFAPPIADPHPLPELERSRSREPSVEEQQHVVDARRIQARRKAEGVGSGEQKLIRQYGAMRIRNCTGEFAADDHDDQCQLAYLLGDEAVPAGRQDVKGDMRLRHMFSTPSLVSASMVESEVDAGSSAMPLRQRRAKPPISIALHQQTTDEQSKPGAVVKKRSSRSTVLSPVSVHSPPPCPPPTTPLPQLPTPRSAPIIPLGGPRRGLITKRSFTRSNSTPVSPFSPVAPLRSYQHAQTQSQGQNIVPAESTAQMWSEFSPPPSSLLTPPLTGLPSLVFDHQPNTPASASATTPVKPTPLANRHKFDSLLAFLSSSEAQHATNDSPSKTGTEHSERRLTASPGSAAVVYGLAL
ncbi:hypothetical protein PANT_12d00066 [Moesziomyces antarcticus T-34]|uniref:Uncharacterized protein n=1 Tax=Pseudozyma antarctica (strain T-34) TaxID=1151754 RepID=M9LWG1_PSEA3|nr:hypothetical protein PANT_12d00066 [Moesziomyces antarcticus T-34]